MEFRRVLFRSIPVTPQHERQHRDGRPCDQLISAAPAKKEAKKRAGQPFSLPPAYICRPGEKGGKEKGWPGILSSRTRWVGCKGNSQYSRILETASCTHSTE